MEIPCKSYILRNKKGQTGYMRSFAKYFLTQFIPKKNRIPIMSEVRLSYIKKNIYHNYIEKISKVYVITDSHFKVN